MQHKTIRVTDLAIGNRIVEGKNKPIKVRTLDFGRSCRNLHVNGGLCYDRYAFVTILAD